MMEIPRVRLQNMNSDRNHEIAQERPRLRRATARYGSSRTLQSSYSMPTEAPRHISMDIEHPPADTLSLQVISPCYHDDSLIPGQPWWDNPRFQTYGTAASSYETDNAGPTKSQYDSSFYTQGGSTLHSDRGLDMVQNTAAPGFCVYHGPSCPSTGNAEMRRPLESPGLVSPSEGILSLNSVEMERQPANIGYEPLSVQEQCQDDNDRSENLPFGHDSTSRDHPRDIHRATGNLADRPYSYMENFWLLHGLPRSLKWVTNPWRRIRGYVGAKANEMFLEEIVQTKRKQARPIAL